jgi:hypothetical protein
MEETALYWPIHPHTLLRASLSAPAPSLGMLARALSLACRSSSAAAKQIGHSAKTRIQGSKRPRSCSRQRAVPPPVARSPASQVTIPCGRLADSQPPTQVNGRVSVSNLACWPRRVAKRMSVRAGLLTATLVLGLSTTPIALAQEPGDPFSDDDRPSLDALAVQAGTTAGLADSCNADPAPISSALRDLLHAYFPDHARRHSVWVRYKSTESSTVLLLGSGSAADCSQITMIVQKEVRRLADHVL